MGQSDDLAGGPYCNIAIENVIALFDFHLEKKSDKTSAKVVSSASLCMSSVSVVAPISALKDSDWTILL